MKKIKDLPKNERPREKLLEKGAFSLRFHQWCQRSDERTGCYDWSGK